jgi:hypothetical protein
VIILSAIVACDIGSHRVTLVNSTDSRVCYGVTSIDPQCRADVKPHTEARWSNDCYSDSQPMTVLLSLPSGEVIYTGDYTCGAFKGATLTITRPGEEFVVTENLLGD